ncbi:LysM peptidoglycan-binding domain-containing protein [Amnibacterium flavum]|nr:LysM peptidoglycan-binding domain-containing protein [Amnibacterium flavum]
MALRLRGTATLTVLLLGAVGVGVSACTAPAPVQTVIVTATPEPAETVVVTATPTPTPVAEAPVEAPVVPNAPAPVVVEGPANDTGAIPGAQGAASADGNGYLLTYTVVSGDSFFDIAQRFDVPQQQLLRMNPSIPNLGETLYIGQIINLDWQTTR